MPTSDEDLQAKQERNEQLREKLAAEQAKHTGLLREIENDSTAAALDDEAERLQQQIDELKARNTKKAVSDGALRAIDPTKAAEQDQLAAEKANAADASVRTDGKAGK